MSGPLVTSLAPESLPQTTSTSAYAGKLANGFFQNFISFVFFGSQEGESGAGVPCT